MAVDTDVARKIVYDVAIGRPEADSTVAYGDEERAFRKAVEAEWGDWKAAHPDAVLVAPADIPDADGEEAAEEPKA